jgi:POT family proton-dependent oligopeptide transporter
MNVIVIGIVITLLTAIPVVLQFRNHPRGLVVLFAAEMWERFSYYGMRAILIFYLTQHFLFDDRFANGQYGAYTSLVYLLPLIGGFLADKYLGTRKAVVFGAILLVAGHLMMAVEGKPATETLTVAGETYPFVVEGRGDQRQVYLEVDDDRHAFTIDRDGALQIETLPSDASIPDRLAAGDYEIAVEGRDPLYVSIFYLALSLIIMGVGFLKANISSIVGQLYPQGDPRRDPGFTLYYYGINLGAFWATILCAGIGQSFGWGWGFGLAGIGMLAGLVVFMLGKPWLEGKGEPPEPQKLVEKVAGPLSREWLIYIGGILGVAVVWVLVQRHAAIGYLLGAASFVVLGYLAWYMATKCTAVESQRMILALILIGASVVFWTLFEQAGSSMNQFADRNTQLAVGSVEITAGQTQSFNAAYILMFAPVFAFMWAWLGRHRLDPNTPMKFALALVQVGAGFMLLVWGAQFADESWRVPLVFLALAYLLHTTGELCLSPVGLSMVTKLSVSGVLATMMAVWFLSSSWAQWLGGIVAQMTASETVAGVVLDPEESLRTYLSVFRSIGLWSIGLGVVLGIASFLLKHLAHEGEDRLGDPIGAPEAGVDMAAHPVAQTKSVH